ARRRSHPRLLDPRLSRGRDARDLLHRDRRSPASAIRPVRQSAGMTASSAALLAAIGVAALALVPLVAPPYYANLLIPFFAYAIGLMGFNLLFGYTGLLSFGHAMFLGAGAYGAAVLAGVLGIQSFEAVLLAVVLFTMALAIPIGFLCVRNVGIFFGMLTLAFGMLFYSFL